MEPHLPPQRSQLELFPFPAFPRRLQDANGFRVPDGYKTTALLISVCGCYNVTRLQLPNYVELHWSYTTVAGRAISSNHRWRPGRRPLETAGPWQRRLPWAQDAESQRRHKSQARSQFITPKTPRTIHGHTAPHGTLASKLRGHRVRTIRFALDK